MSLPSIFARAFGRRAAAALFCAATLIPAGACAQSIVFTFDDGPFLKETPRMSAKERNQALLDTLARHRVDAALFVTCGFGADRPAGYALARDWGQAGHDVGNHTMTHLDLNSPGVTLARYQKEVLDCERIIKKLPGYQKWFRYTFLRDGDTEAKRIGMRTFLYGRGYAIAQVSMDTKDWEYDDTLVAALKKDSNADLTQLKKDYLDYARERALNLQKTVRAAPASTTPSVLLLHHNLINAMWLDDLIVMFKEMGWTFGYPAAAFPQPDVPSTLAPKLPAKKPLPLTAAPASSLRTDAPAAPARGPASVTRT